MNRANVPKANFRHLMLKDNSLNLPAFYGNDFFHCNQHVVCSSVSIQVFARFAEKLYSNRRPQFAANFTMPIKYTND